MGKDKQPEGYPGTRRKARERQNGANKWTARLSFRDVNSMVRKSIKTQIKMIIREKFENIEK